MSEAERRVLVCGGRTYENWNHVVDVLDTLEISVVIHGAATGADTLAGRYAEEAGIPVEAYPADWHPKDSNGRPGPLDRGAGHRRNRQMLVEGRPELVVAFPGGPGTANMVKRAREAGVEVLLA